MSIPKGEYDVWKPAINDLLKQTTFPYKSLASLNAAFGRAGDGNLKWTGKKLGSLFEVTIISQDQPATSEYYEAGDRAILAITVKEWLTDPARQEACGSEPCIKIATRATIGHASQCFCGRWAPYDPKSDALTPCCQWLVWWITNGLPISATEKALKDEHDEDRSSLAAGSSMPPSSSNAAGQSRTARGGVAASAARDKQGIEALKKERDQLRASLATRDQELNRLTKKRDDLKELLATKGRELDETRQDKDDLKTSLTTRGRELDKVTKEKDELTAELAANDAELDKCREERDGLRASLDTEKQARLEIQSFLGANRMKQIVGGMKEFVGMFEEKHSIFAEASTNVESRRKRHRTAAQGREEENMDED